MELLKTIWFTFQIPWSLVGAFVDGGHNRYVVRLSRFLLASMLCFFNLYARAHLLTLKSIEIE